ncbi:thiol reductant ABC exporter subunit CydD [Atopobacter phocae]|uniref:thiol reductant ABC exporter subunit CydD n=1 Tax=Atopobacter phocae TaxID=136492 RepID=UPI00047198F3|nr:thiol reductant ABC exporter subunit CydD [Atopobacter phocae]
MFDKALLRLSNIQTILRLLAGLSVLQATFIITQAYGLSKAINGLWQGQTLMAVINWIGLFLVSYVLRHVITYIQDLKLEQFSVNVSEELRVKLLKKIFRMGPKLVAREGTGHVTTMVLDGLTQVENYLHLILPKVMHLMIIPWIILAFVFWMDIPSGGILLIVFPIIILFMIILGLAAKSKADKQFQVFQILSNHFIDSLRGIDTLKRLGVSKAYGKNIFKVSEQFREATMSTLRVAILSTFALDFFTTLSVAIVAFFLGLRLLEGQAPLFPALIALILAPEYFLPIRDFSNDYHATLDGKNALINVFNILDLKEPSVSTELLNFSADEPEIQIDALNYTYPESDALAIKNIHLNVKGFKKIGLVGMSGSGKSTLIDLLSGFIEPDYLEARVNGTTIETFNNASWQQQTIYMPQHPYIFKATLRENVMFYVKQVSDDAIIQAIQQVGLYEWFEQLPNGLDTIIGEGARQVSGGQAQRIALARTFLDDQRQILLFDEPTAHLDIETEAELKEAMLPLMANRLTFFATHRLHWMHEMDYIYVLENGEIVESGTLDELIEKQGAFVKLACWIEEDVNEAD